MLLPFSSFAMEKKDEYLVRVSLTRDGEGDKKTVSLSPGGKEGTVKFPMYSRDLKSKYEYTVALSLLELNNKQATVEGYISKAQFSEKNEGVTAVTETISIDKKTMPINERNVMEFQHISDLDIKRSKVSGKVEGYPVTLGLVIFNFGNRSKAKL